MRALRPWSDHLADVGDAEHVHRFADLTLHGLWAERWRSAPDAVVVVGIDGAPLQAGDLDARSAVAARRLLAAGVHPGDHVALSAATSVDLVVAYVAILRSGAVALPMNTAYRRPEVEHIVRDALVVAAIVDDPARGEWVRAAMPGAVVTDPALTGLPSPEPTSAIDGAGPTDAALLVYTSGTTGAPKGAVLTQANLAASAEATRLAWRWTAADRLVLALPLFHMHGLGVGLNGTLASGACAVLHERFEPGRVLDAVRGGASMFFGVPTMWHRLAADPDVGELGRLRLGVSGSAPLPAELHRAIADATGRPPLERYGMSETAMLVSNPFDGERRAGSVGFPLPGVEARLGERDEIEVRGSNVFGGYWQRPEATASSFRDGWFRTGDVGQVDDGYLRIVGRTKELIISGGYNVYPREVEEAVESHPAVVEAAVAGIPHPEWGEQVSAFVVLADEVTDEALAAWCAERLAAYKRPRRWTRIEAVPRNALGKIVRSGLPDVLS